MEIRKASEIYRKNMSDMWSSGKKHNDFNDSALHHVFHDENINPEFNTVIKDHMASYNYDNICNMTVHVKAYKNYVAFKWEDKQTRA